MGAGTMVHVENNRPKSKVKPPRNSKMVKPVDKWFALSHEAGLRFRPLKLFLPCDICSMRSLLLIPAVAALSLVLSACEVQPVVNNTAPPAAPSKVVETVPAQPAGSSVEVSEDTFDTATTDEGAEADANAETTLKAEVEAEAETEAEAAVDTKGDAGGATEPASDDPAAKTVLAETADMEASAASDTTAAEGEPEAAATLTASTVAESAEPAEASETTTDVVEEALPAVTELALAPPPPPPPAELTPSSLVGVSSTTLQTRLGTADFTRREGQMETWQYRLDICVVDYFLFPKADKHEIVSWAWRAPTVGESVDALACRRALAIRDSGS